MIPNLLPKPTQPSYPSFFFLRADSVTSVHAQRPKDWPVVGWGEVVGAVDMGFGHIARGWGEVCTHTHKPHGARVEREGSHIAD